MGLLFASIHDGPVCSGKHLGYSKLKWQLARSPWELSDTLSWMVLMTCPLWSIPAPATPSHPIPFILSVHTRQSGLKPSPLFSNLNQLWHEWIWKHLRLCSRTANPRAEISSCGQHLLLPTSWISTSSFIKSRVTEGGTHHDTALCISCYKLHNLSVTFNTIGILNKGKMWQ